MADGARQPRPSDPAGPEPTTVGPEPSAVRPRGPARRRRRVAVGLGSALLLAAVALGTLRSPLFAADHLTVEGTQRLSRDRVLRIAGIAPGANVVWFDEDAAEERLGSDPWIASATVATQLPDTIVVRVQERVAVGTLETHDGWEVVAADGVILATSSDPPHLPTITAIVPGDDITSLAAELLGAMTPDLRDRVDGLTVGADGLVRLVLRHGVSVTYGAATEAEAKAQSLTAVLAWADAEPARVQEIDVSVPGAPTARLAGGTVVEP